MVSETRTASATKSIATPIRKGLRKAIAAAKAVRPLARALVFGVSANGVKT